MTRPALPRSCANCCAFGVLESEVGIECKNLTTFRPLTGSEWRLARATDYCPDHKTWEEDRAEDAAVSRFRTSLGLPPRRPSDQP